MVNVFSDAHQVLIDVICNQILKKWKRDGFKSVKKSSSAFLIYCDGACS